MPFRHTIDVWEIEADKRCRDDENVRLDMDIDNHVNIRAVKAQIGRFMGLRTVSSCIPLTTIQVVFMLYK